MPTAVHGQLSTERQNEGFRLRLPPSGPSPPSSMPLPYSEHPFCPERPARVNVTVSLLGLLRVRVRRTNERRTSFEKDRGAVREGGARWSQCRPCPLEPPCRSRCTRGEHTNGPMPDLLLWRRDMLVGRSVESSSWVVDRPNSRTLFGPYPKERFRILRSFHGWCIFGLACGRPSAHHTLSLFHSLTHTRAHTHTYSRPQT